MRTTQLYWVDGPWAGRLAMCARPRGGEWLEDEMAGWRNSGVETVCSLLTREEERDLDIVREEVEASAHGMKFLSLPIMDREVPASQNNFVRALEELDRDLSAGRNVVLHCRQGVGRTGLVAACLLLSKGERPDAAVQKLSTARGTQVPETEEQRRWIERYAESFVGVR